MAKGDLESTEVGVCSKCGQPVHGGGALPRLRTGQVRICLDCLTQPQEGVTDERTDERNGATRVLP